MSEYQSSDFAKLRFALKNDLHFFNRHNSWIAYGRISGVIIFLIIINMKYLMTL